MTPFIMAHNKLKFFDAKKFIDFPYSNTALSAMTPMTVVIAIAPIISIFTSLLLMALRIGFEPMTHGLEGRCSILLSYRSMIRL